MDNMTNIISSHNKKINSYNETNGETYNCLLDNKCLADKIIYKAEVETNDGINDYLQKFILVSARQNLSPVSTTIQMSFRNRTHENDTELSKYIWNLKDQNEDFDIK